MLFLCQLLALALKACCDRLYPGICVNIITRFIACSPDREARAICRGFYRTNSAQIYTAFSHWLSAVAVVFGELKNMAAALRECE